MAKHTPDVTDEESPERVADYHGGSLSSNPNSIKNVIDVLKEDKRKEGIALSGLDEKDLNKDRDKNRPNNQPNTEPTIKEPDSGKKEIEEPPQPKTKR